MKSNRISTEKRRCSREEFWIHAESTRVESKLAAACSLRGQDESWSRAWVPRPWDQGSHSDDPLRSAESTPLPGRRRDHRAVLTIDGLLKRNRYKAGLRSNHPHIGHRSSRYRPMPVTLVDYRFRGVPFRVPQSATCTGRRVHRPYPLRRPVHLVLVPAMESVLQADPEPIQRMFENARFRLPFKAPWRSASSVNRRSRCVCDVWQLSRQMARRGRVEAGSRTRRIICAVRVSPPRRKRRG
jgi:hypothetical protein